MPDILHWLGIKKIDRMLSMSNMKHDAIVQTGIEIVERIPIPEEMIPDDSRVEIDAKINAGYFTTGKQFTMEELASVRGRGWEKWEDITVSFPFSRGCFLSPGSAPLGTDISSIDMPCKTWYRQAIKWPQG